jgi:bifunctional non-homologous end joining protein LigD
MQIEPMLLTEVDDDSILDKGWIYQEKHNGVRAIIHVKDHKIVGIRGRSNNPLLYCYPEFKDVKFDFSNGILDGEICVFKNGRSVFYGGVDKRRSVPNDKTLREYPAKIIVFDILQLEEKTLVYIPYEKRLELIHQHIPCHLTDTNNNLVEAVETVRDGRALWAMAKKYNWEGIVCKDPNGIYELGKRSKQFLKLKNYKYADVIVEKTEPNAKGTKIYAHTVIDGVEIDVECQRAGAFNINVGDNVRVKYLDIVGDRLIQPTNW